MKEAGIVNWTSPNTAADNSSGWAGLPGGYRSTNGSFSDVGNLGYWWSSTETNTAGAWFRPLLYTTGIIFRYDFIKQDGFSVRCLRD
jgi:uncharacterized protein (TIGR02145 family)